MSGRAINRWILWLLPLFALRSLVPIGFMIDASGSLVLCSGTTPAAVQATAHAELAHHADHSGTSDPSPQHQHSSAHQSSLCVFAVAGGASAPIPQLAWSLQLPVADQPVAFVTNAELNSLPVLIDRIRGPPRA